MKHCHISILCNELPFLQQKLPFLYQHFDQLIFVDYDMTKKCNSQDGSIEYIEGYEDTEKKITLVKDFDPSTIHKYHGESFVVKQKMFAKASMFVNDSMDVVWATDLDEFFMTNLIKKVEIMYNIDPSLQSIDLPHRIFVYNQYNYFPKNDFFICPRITKHRKGFIYGHCNFNKYGKTIKYMNDCLYHFAFVGYNRCKFKYNLYTNNSFDHYRWLETYLDALKQNKKHVSLPHSNLHLRLLSCPYEGEYPDYLSLETLVNQLNCLS